ncbi:MAG TPA: DUF4198 domain-containing protein [Burkholderiaceae bacterium]|nr:DUF4198 domain-containing protein [Burkholderiaceae bacterium]
MMTNRNPMKMLHIVSNVAAAAAIALLASPACAHGIWFAPRADRLALVYGDGSEDLDVVKRLPRITSVSGTSADGKAVAVQLQPVGPIAFVDLDAHPAIVSATMDNGLWSKDAAGKWHGKGRDEVTDAVISGRYLKYAAHLVTLPRGPLAPLPGLALQMVPVSAKFPLRKNEPLTVRVLFEGKPLARARVWQDMVTDPDGEAVVTDDDGKVTLPVRNQGLNVLKAEHQSASKDPGKTSMTHHTATLSFALPHSEE